MSRSRRKTPITGNSMAESDKNYKVAEHRRERADIRTSLAIGVEDPQPSIVFGDPRSSPKDGRQWLGDRHPELMRK